MTRTLLRAFPIALVAVWFGAFPVLAHTAFEASDPMEGAVLPEPVDRIEVVFTGEAEPAGDGFVVLDGSGQVRRPDRVSSVDDLTWVLEFDRPLAEGTAGVRWSVAAPDAHPIDGSFAFTIAGSAPAAVSGPVPSTPAPVPETSASANTATAAVDLAAFLDDSGRHAPWSGPFGTAARSLSLLGAIVAVGGIAFAAIVLRGSRSDIRSVLFWVRRAAVVLGIGAVLELVHQLAVVNGTWWTVWPPSTIVEVLSSSYGIAIMLRIAGAILMLRAHLDVLPAAQAPDPVMAVQAAVGVGAGPAPAPAARAAEGDEPYLHAGDQAWRLNGEVRAIWWGVVATLAAFLFDGHTVTEGSRVLTAAADVAHVAAGAVWAGGLVMLVHVVWLRHRRGGDVRALQLAVRFSVVAAAALVVAGGAGTVLAAIVLDSVSELWSTPWGRVLMAKVLVVAVAGAAGAYNHKVLIPHMMRRPADDPRTNAEFRRTVTIEGAAMGLVIVLTAVLVGAAS